MEAPSFHENFKFKNKVLENRLRARERGKQKDTCTGIGWKKEEGKGGIRKGKEAGEEGKER